MQFRDILGPSLPLLHTVTVLIRRDKSTLLILPLIQNYIGSADKQSRIKNTYSHKRIAELQRTNINLSFSILS